jgi:hypothetical protein
MGSLDDTIKSELNAQLTTIGKILGSDVMLISSPILSGLDVRVRDAVERFPKHESALTIILETSGGVVEVVERMVLTIRHFYNEVIFLVPNQAMSAGTVFAMSGDRILMNYFSFLGPIDPQIEKNGVLVPALSYLIQFERLNAKAAASTLTQAEYALVSKLDLGDLYIFEQAKEHSRELLINWLSTYKFKNWAKTETRQQPVDEAFRKSRAEEVAELLSKPERWHSHARGIDMKTLQNEVRLQIEDFSKIEGLDKPLKEYYQLVRDYMEREKFYSFVHTKHYF